MDLTTILSQVKAFWTGLSLRNRLVLIGAVAACSGAVLYLSSRPTPVKYDILFTGLSPEDSETVQGELKKSNVPYQLDMGGATVKIPGDKVSEMRIALASSGHVQRSTVGFEIFDKQSFGTTGFVEQMNYRRALQGELERTIRGLGIIEAARVHIAIPERSLFKERDEIPSASVVVRMFKGRALSASQIRGIVNLVSYSVPGLLAERVSLVDDAGRVLSESESESSMDKQHELETTLARRVRAMLERVVGEGHAEVQVTADMDFTKVTTTEEIYDRDKAVLRSEQHSEDWTGGAAGSAGGVAGVRGNLPGTPTPGAPGALPPGTPTPATPAADARSGKVSETRNYEVSKTVQLSQGALPRIRRLHVAILVDGVPDPSFKPQAPEDIAPVIPRTEAERVQLGDLAKQAVGFDDVRGDKLEIKSAPFVFPYLPPTKVPESPWPPWMQRPRNQLLLKIAGGALAMLLTFFALVILVRSFRLRKQEDSLIVSSFPRQIRDVEAELANGGSDFSMGQPLFASAGSGLPPMDSGGMSSLSMPGMPELPPMPPMPLKPRDKAADAAKRDVAKAVRVISSWLGGSAQASPRTPPAKGAGK